MACPFYDAKHSSRRRQFQRNLGAAASPDSVYIPGSLVPESAIGVHVITHVLCATPRPVKAGNARHSYLSQGARFVRRRKPSRTDNPMSSKHRHIFGAVNVHGLRLAPFRSREFSRLFSHLPSRVVGARNSSSQAMPNYESILSSPHLTARL